MNVVGSGFITIINYSGGGSAVVSSDLAILTESSSDILTEASDSIDYES